MKLLQPYIPTFTVHVPSPSNLKRILQIAGPAAGIEQSARPAGMVEQMPELHETAGPSPFSGMATDTGTLT